MSIKVNGPKVPVIQLPKTHQTGEAKLKTDVPSGFKEVLKAPEAPKVDVTQMPAAAGVGNLSPAQAKYASDNVISAVNDFKAGKIDQNELVGQIRNAGWTAMHGPEGQKILDKAMKDPKVAAQMEEMTRFVLNDEGFIHDQLARLGVNVET